MNRLENWAKKKICEVVQSDCMVRFRVYQLNPGSRDETWLDSTLYESWIEQNEEQNASQQVRQLCYATGKVTECSYKHPNKIRNAGDKAKLFSANDESGFFLPRQISEQRAGGFHWL